MIFSFFHEIINFFCCSALLTFLLHRVDLLHSLCFVYSTNHNNLRTIQGEPEECPVCGKVVMQLKRHIRMAHRNENEFECRLCVKSFTSEYYLKVHEKEVHTQNFKCENCDKLFGSLKRLNGHKKRIHGEKNLKCPNCDSCFSTKGDLNTHIKRSHDPSKNNDSLIVPSENNDPLLV